MLLITFKYKDKYTHGEWHEQSCYVPSLEECKRFYGLGIDCDFQILEILTIKEDNK